MLSEKIVAAISTLSYQSDAEWEVNILPFGSVYWKDEMPSIGELFDKPDDMAVIFKIFGMRIQLWDGKPLDSEEQQLWDAVRHQVPNWPLFKRLDLSEAQRVARQEAERQVEEEFESLGSDPDSAVG